jgi:mutator protein MutT
MLKVIAKVIICNDHGEILALRRSADDENRPGELDFPGGNVDEGEHMRAAVRREAQEEAGLALEQPRLVWSMSHPGPKGPIVWLLYVAQVAGRPTVRLSHEHDQYSWYTPELFLAHSNYPKHHTVIEYATAHDLLRPSAAKTVVTARSLLINPRGEVLMLRRSASDPFYGGKWDLPGGRAEASEEPADTAKRETAEEAGIAMQHPRLLFGIGRPRRDGGVGTWLFFAEHVPQGTTPKLGDEHDAYKWIPFSELPQYTDYEILLEMYQFVTEHQLLARN